jgi:colicin import membrane protein
MNEIAAFITANPVAVLTDAKTYSDFYKSVKAQIASFVPDVSTERGRKEIASMAYKVTRSKTAIDDAGKKLNEEARSKINAVDAQHRKIREELESLAEEVRKPLTDWEAAEDGRKERAASDLKLIADMSVILASDTVADLTAKWTRLNTLLLLEDDHLDGIDHARVLLEGALDKLEAARQRVQKQEDDQRELAQLRADQEAREAADRKAKEAAEAERLAKERADKAEAEQKAREERAADEARKTAERVALSERERIEREARAAVAKAEAEAAAIRHKAEREEAERTEKAERERREQAARDADRAHRSRVMGETKAALMTCGPDEETAKKVVLAIIANEIPHVTLRF